MRVTMLIIAGLFLGLPARGEEILPEEGRQARFFELLRRASPLPGDYEAPNRANPEGIPSDDPDLLLGTRDALYLDRGSSEPIRLTGKRYHVLTPVPTPPTREAAADWRIVVSAVRAGEAPPAEAGEALERLRARPEVSGDARFPYLAALFSWKGGDPERTRSELEGGGEDPLCLVLAALLDLEEGNPARALPRLAAALEESPKNDSFRALLGETEARVGAFRKAVEHLRPVVERWPEQESTRLVFARSLVLSGRAGDAIPHLEKLVDSGTNRFGALSLLAMAEIRTGKPEEALEHSTAALNLRPGALPPLLPQSAALASLGRWDEAQRILAELTKTAPRWGRAWRMRHVVALGRGDLETAEACARRWLELAPDSPHAKLAVANALLAAKKTEDAVAALEKTVEEHSRFAPARLTLGDAFRDMGRTEEARSQYGEFLKLVPEGKRADAVREILKGLR